MNPIQMPRYVDDQMQVLWLESDEFVIACTILGVGIMMHAIVLPTIALFFVMPFIGKAKREALPGAVLHVLYSLGLAPLNKEFNDALETEFYK